MKKKAHLTRKFRKQKKKFSFKIALYSALAVILTAIIGSSFTDTSGWYESIKPLGITPPNYVFPIAWTILYILIGFSMILSITNSQGITKYKIISLFAINLFFNALWSILFFGFHYTQIAFMDLIIILLSTLALINICWKVSKLSSWLLLPYALWLVYAGLLNFVIAFMH